MTLEEICEDLEAGLKQWDLYSDDGDLSAVLRQEFSYDMLLVSWLAAIKELGEYKIRDDFRHSNNGLIDRVVDSSSTHSRYLVLARRVGAIVTNHGSRPYGFGPEQYKPNNMFRAR